jgi:hypothetical protein
MKPSEVRKNANRRSDCDYFDIRNRADELEVQSLHLMSMVFPRQAGMAQRVKEITNRDQMRQLTSQTGRCPDRDSFRRALEQDTLK